MKFFKGLFNKEKKEVLEVPKKEKQKKEKQHKEVVKQETVVKYKKKDKKPLRENNPADFENKMETYDVPTGEVEQNYQVEWKKPKVKKVFTPKPKEEEDFITLFGVELKDVKIGDIVTAEVLAATNDGYVVSIPNTYIEATLLSQEYNGTLSVGDKLEVVIYRLYDGIYYASNRRLETVSMINTIAKNMDEDEIVSAKVVRYNRNFFDVKINNKIDGQVYVANIDNKFISEDNAEDYVGKTYDFLVTKKLDSKKYKFELSRKKLLRKAQDEIANTLQVGEEITASNMNLNKGGIEFSYKGLRGFIPMREISNEFIPSLEEIPNFINLEEDVQVQIIDIRKQRGNIQLISSVKSLLPSPWNEFIEKYEINSVLQAEITEIRHYGFIVNLDCGVKTLLHKNNMSTEMAAEVKSYKVGDKFDVKIEEIDFDNNKINITSSI